MSLSEKAKTTTFIHNEMYYNNANPDEKWVRLEDAKQEIEDCRTSWQNLKDTIPKFDAKISFLETHLKACNKLIDEMQRERGLQKQKLRSVLEDMQKIPERRLPLGKIGWLQEWGDVIVALGRLLE